MVKFNPRLSQVFKEDFLVEEHATRAFTVEC